jgi:hypothetical protein
MIDMTTENTDEAVGTQNDARLAMLNAINDQNDQGRVDDMVEYGDDGLVSKFVPSQEALPDALTPSDDNGVTDTELQRMEQETVVEEEPTAPQKIKIKVNGKEMELTQEELIARAQKVEAADQYIIEAARIRKEALHPETKAPSTEELNTQRMEKMRARVRAIQMGTEEEAMAALMEMESRPSVTQEEVVKLFDDRLTFKQAAERFEEEYKDVMTDPMLRQLAIQKDQQLVQQGDTRSYAERYAEIGKELRAWKMAVVAANTPETVKTPETVTSIKQARKSAAPVAPKVANVKSPGPAEEDDSEESPADVIRQIAEKRGGPQWMRA